MSELINLEAIILERRLKLESYILKPNANEWHIKNENNLLECLTNILNALQKFTHFDLWSAIERDWQKQVGNDPSLGILHIEINFNEHGNRYFITLKNFENVT
ncbi:MAG: hypothetical protein V4683_05685 [Bacteroidota bacterium]